MFHQLQRTFVTQLSNHLRKSGTNLKFEKFQIAQSLSKSLSTNSTVVDSIPVITISESCVKRLKELAQATPNQFLRVSVDSGGCSGFEYKFSLDTQLKPDDKIIEKEGSKIVIDLGSIDFLKGSTVDYYEELIRSGFRVIGNPNAEHGCSCGTSFTIKL